MHESHAVGATPPFDRLAARRLREALGMAPGHVAYSLRASDGLGYIIPAAVTAWERGQVAPTAAELTALAGALWCAPGELLGAPRTLREHRLAHGYATQDLARAVGLEHAAYLRMEQTGDWRGNERQSAALAGALRLGVRDFTAVTGRTEKLAELLRSAVTARWEGYVRPVTALVPLERSLVADVLEQLYGEYHTRMTATLSWGTTAANGGSSGRAFLEQIVAEFWALIGPAGD